MAIGSVGAVGSKYLTVGPAGANGPAGPFYGFSNIHISANSITAPTGPGFGVCLNAGLSEKSLSELTRSIRLHRRVYQDDTVSPEMKLCFLKNRIIVEVLSQASYSDLPMLTDRYCDWCDAHNAGLYMLEAMKQRIAIMISFEMETDLVQFNLALR